MTRITCRPFISCSVQAADGIVRNFSNGCAYIETSGNFESGTLLILRTILCPFSSTSPAAEEGLRPISLAVVEWQQELAGERSLRYGMELRLLE